MSKPNKPAIEAAVRNLLLAMGEDVEREGLVETPKRVSGYWMELLEGATMTNEEIANKFNKEFEVSNNPMVVKEVKNLFSHCEHHLALMYNGRAVVAYLPKEIKKKVTIDDLSGEELRIVQSNGRTRTEIIKRLEMAPPEPTGKYKVLGLSKIPRIVDMCCKRLQLQEKIATDIMECIQLATGSESVYVNLDFDHACVSARGVKSEGRTNVTALSGVFESDPKTREEVENKLR